MSYFNQLTRASKRLAVLAMIIVLPVAFVACDQQVEEQSFDQITPKNFFKNQDQFVAAVTAVYAQLRNVIFDPINAQEHTTDEIMVPTRGPDWGDGGIWRVLTQHTFTPNTPALNGSWNTMQVGIARANGVLTSLRGSESIPDAKKAQFEAEARFLRAYYYYWLMDQFGGIPIVVAEGSDLDFPTQPVSSSDPPKRNTRKETFDFILQELTGCTSGDFSVSNCIQNPGQGSIIGNLAVKGDVPYGRATQGAALALTARMLLNAEIYTGKVSKSGISTGTALYEGASAAADRIINSGRYQLEDYFTNFSANNQTSDEIIFAATYAADDGVGFQKQQAFLHYNQGDALTTPWNGFTTIAEFYKSYNLKPGSDGEVGTEDDVHTDRRGKQFMVGQQYQQPNSDCFGDECFSNPSSGELTVRGDAPLRFTLNIPGIKLGNADRPADFPNSDVFKLEAPGARPLKFEIDPSADGSLMGNDFPLFRLAEMYLIKAEAAAKMGMMGPARTAFNRVHEKRGNDPLSMSEFNDSTGPLQHIIAERGRELHFEGTRRSDLIRYEFAHGGKAVGYEGSSDPSADVYAPTFTGPWLFKKDGSQTGKSSEPFRVLFPIPSAQLGSNPNLTQNPGY
ncbi:MAG: RagB/SusD family nutrient uptake outer membrane protein [Salinibacter sp.]